MRILLISIILLPLWACNSGEEIHPCHIVRMVDYEGYERLYEYSDGLLSAITHVSGLSSESRYVDLISDFDSIHRYEVFNDANGFPYKVGDRLKYNYENGKLIEMVGASFWSSQCNDSSFYMTCYEYNSLGQVKEVVMKSYNTLYNCDERIHERYWFYYDENGNATEVVHQTGILDPWTFIVEYDDKKNGYKSFPYLRPGGIVYAWQFASVNNPIKVDRLSEEEYYNTTFYDYEYNSAGHPTIVYRYGTTDGEDFSDPDLFLELEYDCE